MLQQDVVEALLAFRRERSWEQFHAPRNLAAALSVEVAELLEHFIWTSDTSATAVAADKREAIASEVADIAMYLTYFAHDLDIDIDAAVRAKLALNGERYPVDKARGSSRKYTEL